MFAQHQDPGPQLTMVTGRWCGGVVSQAKNSTLGGMEAGARGGAGGEQKHRQRGRPRTEHSGQ
eukprot:947974-Prorocentrum_lima.AAC.1